MYIIEYSMPCRVELLEKSVFSPARMERLGKSFGETLQELFKPLIRQNKTTWMTSVPQIRSWVSDVL